MALERPKFNNYNNEFARMSNYRRARAPGGTFFFTVVTYQRQPLLLKTNVRRALRNAISEVRRQRPFAIDAWVLLPDHLHCIWTLPTGDGDFSTRWSMIKRLTTQAVKNSLPSPHYSRAQRREGMLWQRRFWEHQIRDEDDLRQHINYIYWNPVKHRLVSRVIDWPYSTFHRDVRLGLFPAEWGGDSRQHEDSTTFGEP